MKTETRISKKYLTSAAIWCTALLLVVLVGVMAFFSAASQKTENKGITGSGTEQGKNAAAEQQEQENRQSSGQKKTTGTEKNLTGTEEPMAEDAAGIAPEEELPASVIPDDTKIPAATYPEVTAPFTCIMPVNGTVIKDFTEDIAVYSLTMNDYRVHNGIDIYAPVGTRVAACADGYVERVWEDPFLGACVLINHGGEIRSLYCNLSPERPKGMEAGATVLAGDIIGGVGESMATEMADSDHLHFSVTKDGVCRNPMDYITNYRDEGRSYDE